MLTLKRNLIKFLKLLFTQKGYLSLRFAMTHRYLGNFKFPRSWNEKIQNRKLYDDPVGYSHVADKFLVRDYVKSTIGEKYLIPLLANFSSLSERDFDKLPNCFVIKTSHGGGGKNVRIVSDKSRVDKEKLIQQFNSYLDVKLGQHVDEYFYDIAKPQIIIEELIFNTDLSPLLDYKFHVFKNSGVDNVFLQINKNYGQKDETKTLYDLNGRILEMQFAGYCYGPEKIPLPANFDHMIELAKTLAGDLSYTRVDLYNVDGQIYFGEITLCPASGWDRLNDKCYDFYLGGLWK